MTHRHNTFGCLQPGKVLARNLIQTLARQRGIMADHGSSGTHSHGFEAHASTYSSFVKGSVALAILCFYILVALVAFAFIGSGNLLLGFGGLVVGTIALLIDMRASNSWYISGGGLVLFGLLTAFMLS